MIGEGERERVIADDVDAVREASAAGEKFWAEDCVSIEPMPGEIRLQWWRDVLGGVGRGDVDSHPVAAVLREVVVRYRLPLKVLLDLIDARSFDLYDEPVESLAGATGQRGVKAGLITQSWGGWASDLAKAQAISS